MYDGIQAFGGIKSIGSIFSLYFIILFICGNYILLNVFLAIAVDNLSTGEDEDEDGGKEEEGAESAPEGGVEEKLAVGDGETKIAMDEYGLEYDQYAEGPEGYRIPSEEDYYQQDPTIDPMTSRSNNVEVPPQSPSISSSTKKSKPMPKESSFFIFSSKNRFRVMCHRICNHSYFGNIVLVCIMVSSAMLAAEDPLNSNSERNQILNYFDYFFTTIFTIEVCLKLISYGVILHPGSFCRAAFNLLDILVVAVSLISFIFR